MTRAKFFSAVIVMAFIAAIPASAQGVQFGVKGGVNFTKMSLDNDAVETKSGVGFFVGPTLKIDFLPFLGIQGALMYEQSNSKVADETVKRQAIVLPIDLRVNLKLNEASGLYVATGPQFDFNVGSDFEFKGDKLKETFDFNTAMFGWNFGVGVMLSKKFEIGAVYNLGISKTGELEAEYEAAKASGKDLKPKSSSWKIGVTLFF
ncbi:MAG: PorT family protein [Prevotella sp.]|jgi:hypothetical protein|nr:PorT family protein [Prevotella sp.]